jgi:hypothetical protein
MMVGVTAGWDRVARERYTAHDRSPEHDEHRTDQRPVETARESHS